jgi:hypothetical protein
MAEKKREDYHFFAEDKSVVDRNRFSIGPSQPSSGESGNFKHHRFIYLFFAIGFVFLFVFGFSLLNNYSKATGANSGIFQVVSSISSFANNIFSGGLTGHVVEEGGESSGESSGEAPSGGESSAPAESSSEPAAETKKEAKEEKAEAKEEAKEEKKEVKEAEKAGEQEETEEAEEIMQPPLPPMPVPAPEEPVQPEPEEQIPEENITQPEEIENITEEENITQPTNITETQPTEENETIIRANVSTQVIIRQYSARIGEKVKWEKKIIIEKQENPEQEVNVMLNVEIPSLAEDVVVRKIESTGEETEITSSADIQKELPLAEEKQVLSVTGNIIAAEQGKGIITKLFEKVFMFFRSLTGKLTGFVVGEGESNINVALSEDVNDNDEIIVEYYTEAPYAVENETSSSSKEVVIIGPDAVHYEDVLAYSELSQEVSSPEKIKLYHINNETGEKEIAEFEAYDYNENGLIDTIEWVVPHLSNQTYEIILITKAEHLDSERNFIEDVYESVKTLDGNTITIPSGDYLRVTFERNLTLGKDMTVYAKANCSNFILINNIEVPCDVYYKKLRLEELKKGAS